DHGQRAAGGVQALCDGPRVPLAQEGEVEGRLRGCLVPRGRYRRARRASRIGRGRRRVTGRGEPAPALPAIALGERTALEAAASEEAENREYQHDDDDDPENAHARSFFDVER